MSKGVSMRSSFKSLVVLSLLAALQACNCGGVGSEEDARLAYIGLDQSVDRAIALGLQGFNAASSANIDPQSGSGDVSGTLTVGGQVDQGASTNKGLRLTLLMVEYADEAPEDGLEVQYATEPAAPPALDLQLKNIPNGTFTGTLKGTFVMVGDLEGDVTLNLTLAGDLESTGTGDDVRRKPGTTRITGTATSAYGEYAVDLTR